VWELCANDSGTPSASYHHSALILTGTSPFDLSHMAVDRFGHTDDDPPTLRRACEARYEAYGQGYIELIDADE